MTQRLSLLVALLTLVAAVHSLIDISGYRGGPIQLGKLTVPAPQKAAYDFTGSINQVQLYGCSGIQRKSLQRAIASASKSAAAARDLLDSSNPDPTNFVMMDAVFGYAFTQPANKDDNRNFVRNVYDSISQAVTIVSVNPITKSSARMICLTGQNFGQINLAVGVAIPYAAIIFGEMFWKTRQSGEFSPCDVFGGPDSNSGLPITRRISQAFTIIHELAHLAGVIRTVPERYPVAEFMSLSAGDAMQNAQNYAYAATSKFRALQFSRQQDGWRLTHGPVLQFGCAKAMIQALSNSQTSTGLPQRTEMRKILNVSDGIPEASQFNFTGVQLPTSNDTLNQIPDPS